MRVWADDCMDGRMRLILYGEEGRWLMYPLLTLSLVTEGCVGRMSMVHDKCTEMGTTEQIKRTHPAAKQNKNEEKQNKQRQKKRKVS